MRLGIKFCPTPKHAVDMKALQIDFNKVRESIRWAYFFAKKNNFQEQIDPFKSPPWYRGTQKRATVASSPVEAFLDAFLMTS